MDNSTGRLVLSKGLVNWCCLASLLSNTLLAIHPTADCWDVPRDLPTSVLQFLFWEIAATHYSVICIFKVFLHVTFLQIGLYLSFHHSVMQCCEWFLQPVCTSANFGTLNFSPLSILMTLLNGIGININPHRVPLANTPHWEHESFIFILCFLPLKRFYFC